MKIRRRIALLLAVLLMISAGAMAAAKRYYISYGDSGDPVGWFQELLGVEEDHIYNFYGDTEPYFGDLTKRAVRAFQREWDLTVNGRLDANTLYTLLNLPYYDTYDDPLVWIPMYGGTRYHADWTCSGLYEPREMPGTCAEWLGFTPCLKCFY